MAQAAVDAAYRKPCPPNGIEGADSKRPLRCFYAFHCPICYNGVAMWRLKGCPRCLGGDLFDDWGDVSCLQCGYVSPPEGPAATTSAKNGARTPGPSLPLGGSSESHSGASRGRFGAYNLPLGAVDGPPMPAPLSPPGRSAVPSSMMTSLPTHDGRQADAYPLGKSPLREPQSLPQALDLSRRRRRGLRAKPCPILAHILPPRTPQSLCAGRCHSSFPNSRMITARSDRQARM